MIIGNVREGLRARLATIAGLRTFAEIPESIPVPCAIVGVPSEVLFDSTLARTNDQATFPVRIMVARANDRSAQKALDVYLQSTGASSVKTVIEAESSLGGAANTVKVDRVSGIGVYTIAGVDYLGAEFSVRVWG
jgi:hypothetical protein